MFGLMREHSVFLLLGNLHTKENFNTLNDSPSLMMLPAVVIQLKFLATEAISVCSNIYTLACLFNRCYSVSGGDAGEREKCYWNRTRFFHGNRVLSWHLWLQRWSLISLCLKVQLLCQVVLKANWLQVLHIRDHVECRLSLSNLAK